MAFNVKKHDKVLQRTLDSIDADTFDSVKSLENEVAELVAQGLPVGGEIESLDDGTLYSAFKNRTGIKTSSD